MAEKPNAGCVPPQMEIVFTPESEDKCMFEESMAIIRSSILTMAISSDRVYFPATR